jgi:F0F1-type ATP synthase membrane subunit b/b'
MSAETSSAEIAALRADVKQLRDDLAKLGDTLKETARERAAETLVKAQATADKAWSEAKRQAGNRLPLRSPPSGSA